jgi:hypothetical protein
VVPLIALIGMGAVLWGNIHPFPPAPLSFFPFLTIGLIALLAIIAWWLEKKDPEKVRQAAQLFVITPEDEMVLQGQKAGTPDPLVVDAAGTRPDLIPPEPR